MRDFKIGIIPKYVLSHELYNQIVSLYSRAYEEDLTGIMSAFACPVHVAARYRNKLVSHALVPGL